MKEEKIKKLEEKGWKVGTVSDFLKLSRKEDKYSKTKKDSQNVYADLGIADAEEMLIKAQLVTKDETKNYRTAEINRAVRKPQNSSGRGVRQQGLGLCFE